MIGLWVSAHASSAPECRKQLTRTLIVRVVCDEMRTNILDNRSVPVGISQGIEDLLGSTPGQGQLAAGSSIDKLSMIVVEHEERDCVGAEDLEILQGQMLQVTQEWTLSEDIDMRRAHRLYGIVIHHGPGRLDPQPFECVGVRLEGLRRPRSRPFGGWRVPPQAEKADFAHLIADLIERRQKLSGDFLPSPPIVPEMEDVIDLRRRGGWIDPEGGVIAEE